MATDYSILSELKEVDGQQYRCTLRYYKGRGSGYYAGVTPVKIKDHGNGFISESFTCFSGVSDLLVNVGRFNRKAGEKLIPQAQEKFTEMIAHLEEKAKKEKEEDADGQVV